MKAAFESFGIIAVVWKSGAITLAFPEKVSLGLVPKLHLIHAHQRRVIVG